jgi:hypothetical protein
MLCSRPSHCNGLVIWASAASAFFSYVDRDTLALAKATDGSLLLRRGSTEGMLFMLVPVLLIRDGQWEKYSPIVNSQLPGDNSGSPFQVQQNRGERTL